MKNLKGFRKWLKNTGNDWEMVVKQMDYGLRDENCLFIAASDEQLDAYNKEVYMPMYERFLHETKAA